MNSLRKYLTKLNLHLLALAAIVVVDIFLAVHFALAWSAIRSDQSGNFVQEQVRYGQLLAQMKHVNGLPQRVQQADEDAQKFYDARIAPNYSTVVAQLDGTAVKDQVRLTRDEYAQAQAAGGLTEVQIDAGLSGEYTDMMHFINDLERDKDHVFFTIARVAFTGQQGGLVNLRLRVITYLRPGAPDLPPPPPATAAPQSAAAPGGGAQ